MKLLALLLAGLALAAPAHMGSTGAGFTAASADPAQMFSTAADFNTVTVTLADPGTPLRGNVTLSANAASDRGIASVTFQVSAAGANGWGTVCTATAVPYSCTWSTTTVSDGLVDVRALGVDTAGYARSDAVASRRVDNTAPTATIVNPGSPLRGSVTLSTGSSDSGSGLASVRYEYRVSPAGSWTTACTGTTTPFSCSWNTTSVVDGSYDLRAVATDAAGNADASAAVTARSVDNTAPSGVTLVDPGSPLRGSVPLSGTALDAGSGIASMRFQYAPAGTTAWTDACVATSAPYSCSWATAGVADGLYDMRALATDVAGNTASSATIANRRVDNTAPRATDVQGANGGTGGKLDAGDTLTLSYSETMAPGTILAGWSGASTAVTVRVTNSSTKDLLAVWNATGTARVALTSSTQDLQLNNNWVTGNVTYNATMVQSGANVVVTIGAVVSGAGNVATGVTGTTAIAWAPSTAATDIAGNACSATAATESGAADRDF